MDIKKWLPNIATLALAALLVITQVWAGPLVERMTAATETSSKSTINYQGYLTDAAGNPVNDTLDMVFRLYDVETGGEALWAENHNDVSVTDGLFSVLLGGAEPMPNPIPQSLFAENDSLWLGISVGGDSEMTPRERLSSAPSAMTIPNGAVTTDKLNVDDALEMNSNMIRYGLVWPPSYDGRGSRSALPGFEDTLYYAMSRGITVDTNRTPDRGSLERMFNLHRNSYAQWNSVNSANPVVITLTYSGRPYLNGVLLAFGWRSSHAIDYYVEYYEDGNDDGDYTWTTIADVEGNARYEVYHPASAWRVKKIRITVTDAGDGDQDQRLRIATIQAPSAIHGKAAGHMVSVGGDTMYGDLHLSGADSDLTVDGTKSAVVNTRYHGRRKLYAAEAPEVRFFDEGLAHLKGGVARVTLDPVFLETIEGDYLVHITPYGDANLYVADIGEDYFVVRAHESDPDVTFSWRLSAHRKGYSDVRLEKVTSE